MNHRKIQSDKIDRLVYDLYGHIAPEVAIIEDKHA